MARFRDTLLRLLGASSGETTLKAAATAGGTITLPAGTTDFSATGGSNLFVGQASTGAALTVTKPTTAITGTTTNNNATAGELGEYIESNVASGAGPSLTSSVSANVTSITLTAGDWLVQGNCNTEAAGTTVIQQFFGCVNDTSAAFTNASRFCEYYGNGVAAFNVGGVVPLRRFSLSGTTIIYLVIQASFTTSTCKANGTIWAKRIR